MANKKSNVGQIGCAPPRPKDGVPAIEVILMKKVLVVADCSWWAFGRIYRGLKRNIDSYEIHVLYTDETHSIPHQEYDVVLFLCDHIPWLIAQNGIPRHKLIWAIRMGRQAKTGQTREQMYPIYSDRETLGRSAAILAAANQTICDEFRGMHPNVVLAPGGVDTDVYTYKEFNPGDMLRVGWSGSNQGRGGDFRNLNIIRQACEMAGCIWKPALREDRMRSEEEMVRYYHNEIDVYVEMSTTAGRQNGMIEAAACGCPVISAPVGITPELIRHGENGFVCDVDAGHLAMLLRMIRSTGKDLAWSLYQDIEQAWSWKAQAKIFEEMFDQICAGVGGK
jgi:glycosyltransferase involved in cell wall biosynthesis